MFSADTFTLYPKDYVASLANVFTICEPCNYHEAKYDSKLLDAMQHELLALESKNTWAVVDLPLGKQPIGCKWVFKVKYKADSTIE